MAKKKPTTTKAKTKTPRKPRPRPLSFTDGVLDPEGNAYKYTALEKKFITEYLNDPRHNATAAAKAAGYDAKSDATFRAIASQVLAKEHVRAAINRAFESLTMPKYETLFRIGKIASGSIVDVLNDDNELDLDAARDRGTDFLIRKIHRTRDVIEVKEGGEDVEKIVVKETVKFEIHDPLKALELLGRHGKLFVDRVEATGKDGNPLIPEDGPQVVFYIPDNGRGDGDNNARPQTKKQTTRRPKTPDPALRDHE